MGQPDQAKSNDVGTDITERGPAAWPDYGPGATFYNPGNTRPSKQQQRDEVELLFSDCLQRAIEYRLPIEQEWLACYTQYNGDNNDAQKQAWQSQVHMPKAQQAVDTTAGKIMAAIFGTEEWFSPLSPSKATDPKLEFAKVVIPWKLRDEKVGGEEAIAQAIKHALICGNGPLKVHWRSELHCETVPHFTQNPDLTYLGRRISQGGTWGFKDVEVGSSNLVLEPLMPWDVFLDPSGLNRFKIVRTKRFVSDLWEMARELKDSNGKVVRPAIYDPQVVSEVITGDQNARLDMESAVTRRELLVSNRSRTCDIWEFFGSLPDPINGAIRWKNILATFVNQKRCLRPPQRNPFLHAKDPLIFIRASMRPGQVYGRGILAQGLKLQAEIDRHAQTLIDRTRASMGMMEADPNALRDGRQLTDHPEFKPLKVWIKRPGPERKIFTYVQGPAPVNEWEVQLLSILSSGYESSTKVDEWSTGQNVSTNRKTRAEAQSKAQAASEPFNDAAQYIERTSLTPAINMIWKLIAQFQDWNDQRLDELFADKPEGMAALQGLRGLELPERWQMLQLDPEMRVTGVTMDIMRQQMIGRLQTWAQMNGLDPVMGAMVDKANFQRLMTQMLNLPKNLVLANADQILTMFSQAQAQAIVGQMMGAVTGSAQGPNANNQGAALGAAGREAASTPIDESGNGPVQ